MAIYNYSGARGEVKLKLKPDDWFSLVDDVSEKSVEVDSARVGGTQFTLEFPTPPRLSGDASAEGGLRNTE